MSLLHNVQIGASGLRAANAALSATSHNVVNSTTEGFQRRGVSQTTSSPARVQGGMAGRGVSVTGFVRSGSDLIMQQQVAGEGAFNRSATRSEALSPLEALVDETTLTGPHAATAEFFDSLQLASQDPSDSALRRSTVSKAQNMARSFRQTAKGFDQALESQTEALDGGVDRFNDIARKLANVNRDIVAQQAPGDLLDERDRLLKSAAMLTGSTADLNPDGTANLVLGGHAVVSGTEARTVSLTANGRLAVDAGAGAVEVDAGGELGGLLDAAEVTRGLKATLSDAALALADALNTANGAGFDQNGTAGADLFTYDPGDPSGSLRVADAVGADPSLLAYAGAATAQAGDGDNLAVLGAVQEAGLVGGKTVTDALSSLTSDLASVISRSNSEAEHGGRVLDDLNQLQSNLAGVDLDEEAANLMLFQTAYQASAKVIRVNDELMSTLLEIV